MINNFSSMKQTKKKIDQQTINVYINKRKLIELKHRSIFIYYKLKQFLLLQYFDLKTKKNNHSVKRAIRD